MILVKVLGIENHQVLECVGYYYSFFLKVKEHCMAKVTELQQELDKKIEAEKSSFVNGGSQSTIKTMEQQCQITGMHNF